MMWQDDAIHDAIPDGCATAAYWDDNTATLVDDLEEAATSVDEAVGKLASAFLLERGEGWRHTKHSFHFLFSNVMRYLACWNRFS